MAETDTKLERACWDIYFTVMIWLLAFGACNAGEDQADLESRVEALEVEKAQAGEGE